jgi:hypothetical protein
MNKDIKEIAWDVSEDVYRSDAALSYSLLSRYEKVGFSGLDSLFEKQESDSLLFGSLVDTIITQPDEFSNRYFIVDSIPSGTIQDIVEKIFEVFSNENSLSDIADSAIVEFAKDYQPNWKDETKAKKIREGGKSYFQLLKEAKGKIIIPRSLYQEASDVKQALFNAPLISSYFCGPQDGVLRYNQLKFKTFLNGIEYKCMFDLLCVNYNDKWILPVDLKTTSFPEYEFYKRYLECRYDIQSKLYWRILNKCLKEDDYFKDFKLYNFQFVCVNKHTLNPIAWYDDSCTSITDLTYTTKTNRKIILRDPETIGQELAYYLANKPKSPKGIVENKPNNITNWINKM